MYVRILRNPSRRVIFISLTGVKCFRCELIRPTKNREMSEFLTVDIPQGKLRGRRVTSSTNGVTYYSFQGIPYAKPPVGPLRFKPPGDPDTWTGIRDATVEGAISPQVDIFSKKIVGDEDCLFLNVYTPHCSPASPKAVMLWIHGGGFFFGSGNTDIYGPDFLVAEDVVLVTINYRLGALGFLHLEEADVTGSNGLRDQVMALKWVRNNIAHFGGDPDNVTIFGESAGAISVHQLMLSPLAAGLFHKSIAQSGTALLSSRKVPPDVNRQRVCRLAKFLGCTSEDPREIVHFLRTVPSEKLVAHKSEALSEDDRRKGASALFFPAGESGLDAFLPASPRKLLVSGQFTKVPFMIGVTSGEGKVMLLEDIFSRKVFSDINQQIKATLPLDPPEKIADEVSKKIENIKKFYFGEKHFDDKTITQYIDMMTDLWFVYLAHKVIQEQVKWSPQPTYVYLFDHMSAPGIELLPKVRDDLPGVAHGAELPYLFQSSVKPNTFPPGSPDAKVLAKTVKLWTQFAKTGNPSSNAVDVKWIPATKEKFNYFKINGGFNMESDMYKHRINFLEQIYSDIWPLVD